MRAAANPLALILLIAAGASALLGEARNAILITAIVVLSAGLNLWQSFRSEHAVRKLQAEIAPTATALRDGEWREIPRRHVVPGDVVQLTAGDLVPADARLIESHDLHVQQAALTGESLPVEKAVTGAGPLVSPGPGSPDLLYLGTSIVSGTATAVVFATGAGTAFGDIVARLAARPEETEFERGTRRFGLLILRTVLFLVLFILVVSLSLRRDALQSLLFAVALAVDAGRVVLGSEVALMDDGALARTAELAHVFARLSPAQKHRIIRALRGHGHVVGFLGDGINDAPSLHGADVGISVAGAADVAREASDIILLERKLGVLHAGILAGRESFGNVLKYLLMGTSSNFGNMFSMAGAALFLPFLPMLPTQILLNNFLYDVAQVTIPTDNVDPALTARPQRWDVHVIRNFMLAIGPLSSLYDFVTFGVLLLFFRFGERQFHTGWFVESLATQTLVLFVIRTAGRPWRNRPSTALAVTTLAVALIGVALPYSPLAAPLGFAPLPGGYFAFLLPVVGTYLVLVELVKHRIMERMLSSISRPAARSPG